MHSELVDTTLKIAERDPVAKHHLDELRRDSPEVAAAEIAGVLLEAARERIGMSDATAAEILAAHNRVSARLRSPEVDGDELGADSSEPQSTPGEATIRETTGPVFDPVAELDRFRHDPASSASQNVDIGEHGKQIDRERAAGRRVVRVSQDG